MRYGLTLLKTGVTIEATMVINIPQPMTCLAVGHHEKNKYVCKFIQMLVCPQYYISHYEND